jgi:hypothetical protein
VGFGGGTQMDCVVLHVSQWQQLLSIVHRRHWVDQIATWPLFATLNAIQRRSLNDNLHYVQFPAGETPQTSRPITKFTCPGCHEASLSCHPVSRCWEVR